jgi:hypothetical protein
MHTTCENRRITDLRQGLNTNGRREVENVDSRKVVNLLRNWSSQLPLTSGKEEDQEKSEVMHIEDIAVGGSKQNPTRRSSVAQDTTNRQIRPPSDKTPLPMAELRQVYDLEKIGAIWKVFVPQSVRIIIHDRAERPSDWYPACILRT